MKPVFFALLLALALAAPALAQEPPPDLPYHFEPIEIPPPEHEVPINITGPDFINLIGSYALTLFTLLDQYQVLGIFVVIMLGLSALWWLWSFVTDRPVPADTMDVTGGLDIAEDMADDYYDEQYRQAEAHFKDIVGPSGGWDRERATADRDEQKAKFKNRTKTAKKIIRYF
jgi:hypothetical protein